MKKGFFMIVTFMIEKEDNLWIAKCVDYDIFTQAKTLDKLMDNIKEAVKLHFENSGNKETIQILSLSKSEVSSYA